jgi:hypothetical protein
MKKIMLFGFVSSFLFLGNASGANLNARERNCCGRLITLIQSKSDNVKRLPTWIRATREAKMLDLTPRFEQTLSNDTRELGMMTALHSVLKNAMFNFHTLAGQISTFAAVNQRLVNWLSEASDLQ